MIRTYRLAVLGLVLALNTLACPLADAGWFHRVKAKSVYRESYRGCGSGAAYQGGCRSQAFVGGCGGQVVATPVYAPAYAPTVAPTPQVVPVVPVVPISPQSPAKSLPVPVTPTKTGQVIEIPADPYGFLAWINGYRSNSGLAPVAYSALLSQECAYHNTLVRTRGWAHHGLFSARRQNVGMGGIGSASTVWSAWTASEGHWQALADPTIREVGIAANDGYWTYSAR